MSAPFYFLLAAVTLSIAVIIFFVTKHYKKNNRTELYSEGIRNENNGLYEKALHNYEDALTEVHKLKVDKKLGERIEQKIKILRTTIDYEKNFSRNQEA